MKSESNPSRLLTAHNVDLAQARQIVAKRRYRSGIAPQLPPQLKEKVAKGKCRICNRLFGEHSQKAFDDCVAQIVTVRQYAEGQR